MLFNSLVFILPNVSKKNARVLTHIIYFALLKFMEVVKMDVFFLLTSTMASPLY